MARRLVGGPVLLARSDAAKEVEIPPAASPTRGPAATGQASAAVVDRPGGDGGVGAAVATGTPRGSAGHARDDPGLAPPTGRSAMNHSGPPCDPGAADWWSQSVTVTR